MESIRRIALAILVSNLFLACTTKKQTEVIYAPSPGETGEQEPGTSTGAGGFLIPNAKRLMEVSSQELAQMLRLASPEIFAGLAPLGMTQEDFARIVGSVRLSPKATGERDGKELMFNYGVDAGGVEYIEALQPYFFSYAWVSSYYTAEELWKTKKDIYRQLLHEVVHHIGVGVAKGTDDDADKLARKILAALEGDQIRCISDGKQKFEKGPLLSVGGLDTTNRVEYRGEVKVPILAEPSGGSPRQEAGGLLACWKIGYACYGPEAVGPDETGTKYEWSIFASYGVGYFRGVPYRTAVELPEVLPEPNNPDLIGVNAFFNSDSGNNSLFPVLADLELPQYRGRDYWETTMSNRQMTLISRVAKRKHFIYSYENQLTFSNNGSDWKRETVETQGTEKLILNSSNGTELTGVFEYSGQYAVANPEWTRRTRYIRYTPIEGVSEFGTLPGDMLFWIHNPPDIQYRLIADYTPAHLERTREALYAQRWGSEWDAYLSPKLEGLERLQSHTITEVEKVQIPVTCRRYFNPVKFPGVATPQ